MSPAGPIGILSSVGGTRSQDNSGLPLRNAAFFEKMMPAATINRQSLFTALMI